MIHKRALNLGLVLFILALVGALLVSPSTFRLTPQPDATPRQELTRQLHADESVLLDHAAAIRAGRLFPAPGSVVYPLPLDPLALPVHAITMDDNKNVYFILKDSFTHTNRGIILRADNVPLLGDRQEPRITRHERLFGDWWVYASR